MILEHSFSIFRFTSTHQICMETFKDHPQLGRFTLRDEGLNKINKIFVFSNNTM